MKPTNYRGSYDRRDDAEEYENPDRQPVGNRLFDTNRRFASDYANFDTAHAVQYQRHSDFEDEYNNIREGYYRNRGTRTGNSEPSMYPDRWGNRYGTDGNRQHAGHYGDHNDASLSSGQGYGHQDRYASQAYSAFQPGAADWSAGGRPEYGYRGKGPKNYTRSDERIREDVADRLRDDEHIDASDIEVSVEACEVVLSGLVDSRFAKRHAEDLAETIPGVRNVENRIRVRS